MINKMLFKAEGNVLTMERTFNAPVELVFNVFSDSEHLKQWFGPRGWSITVSNLDFRPGGAWHYCMKCEDKNQGDFYGMESWGITKYQEIVANEKIVNVDYFSDAEGNIADNMPAVEVTMTFEAVDGKTKLTSIGSYATEEALKTVIDMGMQQGITETWDRLEEHLESIQ